ncbi:LysE family translocator [Halarcobacter ebronensis]|uniref:Threonine transporter n=1 Tax=Halarcobacter ebronensis TaxID=1462615 RepID=A0A4Q1AR68_9BACT|nr:LysE family translocator [Halarcobacter ebronensis]QKF80941.1 transporter, LysE family [Halarcobacter ebronensis]RXK06259.1 threonine transporter [Halarcobacter ebronensis]
MSFESSLTFFLAILIFGITPGPGVFALLARGMTLGAKQCIPLALGMTISDVIYLIFACLGLATIAHNYAFLFEAIRILGAVYLFYLGYKMFTAPIELEKTQKKEKLKKDFLLTFIQGFLISASNPKVILFYIAFLPTFLDIKSLNTNDIIWVSFLTIVALMIGLMFVSILANKAKQLLKSKKSLKRLNYTAGSIMIAAGSFLLFNKQA